MPTRAFASFGPETVAILVRAYDGALQDLELPPRPPTDGTVSRHHALARHIMALAAQGERDVRRLRVSAVTFMRLQTV